MSDTISKYDDIIDSRDVIARIEELQEQLADGVAEDVGFRLDSDDEEELIALSALAREADGYTEDWTHGVTLIRDSYFKTYAMDFAEDIGAIPKDARWPADCIDWDQAARELQMDYTCVSFDGVDYWVR